MMLFSIHDFFSSTIYFLSCASVFSEEGEKRSYAMKAQDTDNYKILTSEHKRLQSVNEEEKCNQNVLITLRLYCVFHLCTE